MVELTTNTGKGIRVVWLHHSYEWEQPPKLAISSTVELTSTKQKLAVLQSNSLKFQEHLSDICQEQRNSHFSVPRVTKNNFWQKPWSKCLNVTVIGSETNRKAHYKLISICVSMLNLAGQSQVYLAITHVGSEELANARNWRFQAARIARWARFFAKMWSSVCTERHPVMVLAPFILSQGVKGQKILYSKLIYQKSHPLKASLMRYKRCRHKCQLSRCAQFLLLSFGHLRMM